jgi:ATP diphosphatase
MQNDIYALLAIMDRLRHPEHGCPWDLRQTFESIAPYTVEEAYEVADAIDRCNMDDLCEELGDLLLQVVFHSQIACERRAFDWNDVVETICNKLVQRHQSLFDGTSVPDLGQQRRAWEQAKEQARAERGADSLMDGIPRGMAELQRALKLQKRAARVGFDWPAPGPVLEKLQEEFEEVRQAMAEGDEAHIQEEVGDLLFVVVNLARQLQVDPGAALRHANAKFEKRFRALERAAGDRETLEAMSLKEMEALWVRAKESEGKPVNE